MPKVSCIIPVYNERARISNVLRTVCTHPLVDEVIVVDDGSAESIKDITDTCAKATLVVHEKNLGKSRAVATGISRAAGDTLFLLDADLLGLSPDDVANLITPVISEKADVAISMRKNSPRIDRAVGIDLFSGDRVFRRELVENHLDEIGALSRFGLESYLNKLIIKRKYKVKIVFWKNVISPWKYEKSGFLAGIKGDIFMGLDILKTISIFEIIYQYGKILSLRIRSDN